MTIHNWILASCLLCLPLAAQDAPRTEPAQQETAQDARLAELTRKAESGDATATQQLYTEYALQGNTEQAKAWATRYEEQLTAQAESGDAKSMMQLATAYLKGQDYMPQNPGKAVSWFVRAAESGQPAAAFILGELFTQQGNTAEAEKFYKMAYSEYEKLTAAISGDQLTTEQRNALYWQGYMQLMGIGTTKNEAEGVAKIERADNAWAWSQLYKCYVKGIGVKKDISRAIGYARKLADEVKDGMMAWVVGSAYLSGQDVPKDETLGRKYLEQAADANIAEAIYHKGVLLQAEGKNKEAYDCFNQAGSMGMPAAMTATAKLLLTGADGIVKDEARALKMLQTASDYYNDLRAPYELGLYYDGVGEPELANNWYRIASDRGVIEAMARRGLLHITPNSGVNWSPTQMYRWWRTGSDAGDATCSLYLNLFLFGFIPLVLLVSFGVPILVVHLLNKKAQAAEEQAATTDTDK